MFTFDKRFLYIIMAIIIIRGLMPYFTDVNMLIGLLMSLPAVLIAITFHEFAHAYAADKLGDETPRQQGYSKKTRTTKPKSICTFRPSRNFNVISSWIWMGKTCTNKSKKF